MNINEPTRLQLLRLLLNSPAPTPPVTWTQYIKDALLATSR